MGSFFLVLVVALVALGFFLSDAMHLREDLNHYQKEIEKLIAALQKTEQELQNALVALQKAEQEKQNALVNLQNTGQQLLSCNQEVDQTKQFVVQLTNEITALKKQISLVAGSVQSIDTIDDFTQQFSVTQATTFSLLAFLTAGLGSIIILVLKGFQKRFFRKGSVSKTGHYVYVTNDEIKELAQRRRAAGKTNFPYSNG
ncbi:MAG TPA: hypothetical protein VN843_36285 [Anaerolineales bacterium]|nr:hypothetical protein [Anaerolineales bacterium]